MSTYRKWYCTCTGKPEELEYQVDAEEEFAEPICRRCGASQSSDPRKTILYRDVEDWED